ncbi:MAG: hypothetical protein JO307_17145 [Bryobacterales bacterium]|nr:hypothetical protein [Bryobacterales bacterium]
MIDFRCLRGIALCACAVVIARDSACAQSLSISGHVVDRDSGAAIAATVEVLDAAGSPLARTATDRRGRYTLLIAQTAGTLIVAQAASPAYAAFHGAWSADTLQSFEHIGLSRISSEERAWLAGVNADRAKMQITPVTIDEAALLSARQHAKDMAARGYFDHADRSGRQPWQRFLLLHGTGGDFENIARGEDASWLEVQRAFLAEGPPKQPGMCTHFSTLFDPRAVWIGLGIARSNKTYFDQEFIEYPY